MNNFDIIVLGNGILGLATAYALITDNPSLKIGVLGPSDMEGSATAAAGAMLGCFGEVTTRTLSSDYDQAKFEMNINAAKLWSDWLNAINGELDEAPLEIKKGTHVILNSKSGILDCENYEALISTLNQYQEPWQEVHPLDIVGLDPIEDCRPIKALYLPQEGSINVATLLNKLQAVLRLKKVCLLNEKAKTIHTRFQKIVSVETEHKEIYYTNQIVIAAGVYSQALVDSIPELHCRIPRIFSGVGQAVILEHHKKAAIKNVIRTTNRSLACGLHVVPRTDNTVYVGATNNLSVLPQTKASAGYTHFLLQCVIDQVNQTHHESSIVGLLCGNRPVSLDAFPLIGPTSIAGLWLLSGTYRDGLHLSPLLAKYISTKMLKNSDIFQNPFLPERRPLQTMSKAQMINETVKHFVAGAYEHGMHLPRLGWVSMFENSLRKRFEHIYSQLETDVVVPPEFMLIFNNDEQNSVLSYFRNHLKKTSGAMDYV